MAKRIPKSKPEIIDTLLLKQEADRQREILTEKIFPYLIKADQELKFLKVALQVSCLAANQSFDRGKKTTTIKDLKVADFVNKDNEDYEFYIGLFNLLEDESVQSFNTLLSNLPTYIDGYFESINGKKKMTDLDLNAIIG